MSVGGEKVGGVEQRCAVLVALAADQREARGEELARLERSGIEMLFEETSEGALARVEKLRPSLVLVGMTIGDMEGLELLATLFKRVPDFAGKVVVLPDKGDPFPPMLQGRDPVTKKSTTSPIDFAGIEALVDTIVRAAAPPPPAPAPPPPPAVVAAPVATAPPPLATASAAPTPPRDPPKRLWVFALGAAAVFLFGWVAIVVVRAGGAASGTTPSAVRSADGTSPPTAGTASSPPSPVVAAPAEDAQAPNRPEASLDQLTTLPLSFGKGSADFEVTNAAELDATVASIKAALGTSMLEVGGHTSTEGTERVNEELSLRRASNVKRYLVAHGIPEDHIVLRDYKTSAARSATQPANRRVTLRVLR
jgi:outer membrane protein OmpA-like peptidoglycan-associated protein